jgi:DUF3108-like
MQITKSIRLIGLGAAVCLAGCGPSTTQANTSSGQGGASAGTPGPNATSEPPAPTVPEALKYASYVYNGFDRSGPLTYLFAKIQGDQPTEGTQVTALKSVKDGIASFEVTRTGSLQRLGDEDLLVKPDGIYMERSSVGTPSAPVKVMPTDFKIGTVWDYDYVLNTPDGKKIRFKGKGRVEKEEKVKVAAGEFDTLMTTETATMDNDGVKGSVSSKSWYAKDIGAVKMKMEVKDSKGQILQSSLELAKVGDK